MNSSYKITLLVTIVLCGLILGYYISLDDQNQPPKLDDTSADVATNHNAASSPDQTRPTLRDPSAGVSTGSNSNPNPNTNPNTYTPPAATTTPPAASSSNNTGSLLDRVNARVQGSNDPIAPPPAATIPAASSNNTSSTTPVTPDARSITTGSNTPSTATPASNNSSPAVSRNPTNIPDTGRSALRSNVPTTGRTYTIKSGDTLSSIAEQTLGSTARWNDIAEANPYLDPRKLKVGQVIRLPDPASSNSSASATSSTSTSTAAGPLEYVVREGDTLSRIARVHYSDPNLWDVIYRANKAAIGSDPAGIKPGMKLFIPPEPRTAH